jgi:S-adenosyl methyltransferase
MADRPDWAPPGVDTKLANAARVYDYWLGGTHNFPADQAVGRAVAAVEPNMRLIARANRAFLGRAVRYLASAGIPLWRPSSPADVPADLTPYGCLAGVARKPG